MAQNNDTRRSALRSDDTVATVSSTAFFVAGRTRDIGRRPRPLPDAGI
jgi:hypothetical protein